MGKGTEGWNCRSLVAVALYKKPKSTILVLQSTTRCLRSIGDNSTKAHIFLSQENYKILDRELKNNFAASIDELNAQDQETVEYTLKVEKRRTVKVNKPVKDILAVQASDADSIKIDFGKFKASKYQTYVSEGGVFVTNEGQAGYSEAKATRQLKEKNNLTFYEIAEIINRYTHLPCLTVENIVTGSGNKRDDFVKMVNDDLALLPFVIQEILNSAYTYEEKTEMVEEELELTKFYPFKINISQGRTTLVVYREDEEEGKKERLGFHVNPYSFDSGDEKDLFRYLRQVLEPDEAVKDVYFTGARVAADPQRTDFYFEYYSPEKKRMARYFPDFLVETSKGRFMVLEVKNSGEKADYEANKRSYGGKLENLSNEILAKELGFQEFKTVNQDFEYRIVFNASLQQEQVRLLEEIREME